MDMKVHLNEAGELIYKGYAKDKIEQWIKDKRPEIDMKKIWGSFVFGKGKTTNIILSTDKNFKNAYIINTRDVFNEEDWE